MKKLIELIQGVMSDNLDMLSKLFTNVTDTNPDSVNAILVAYEDKDTKQVTFYIRHLASRYFSVADINAILPPDWNAKISDARGPDMLEFSKLSDETPELFKDLSYTPSISIMKSQFKSASEHLEELK